MLNEFVELYQIEESLDQKAGAPTALIKYIMEWQKGRAFFQNFTWEINELNLSNIAKSSIQIVVGIQYIDNTDSKENILGIIQNMLNVIRKKFPQYQIECEIDDAQGYSLLNNHIIDVKYIVYKKLTD